MQVNDEAAVLQLFAIYQTQPIAHTKMHEIAYSIIFVKNVQKRTFENSKIAH